jgi:3-deoxy-manno-octulosonate cytidylyltransferase (CMP-KDO synthetase)
VQRTSKIIGVIPSRLASTRLPRKPLLPIAGKAMVQRVYEGCLGCKGVDRIVVATDSGEIAEFCRQQSIPVCLTSPEHASGTDRVHEVVQRLNADAAINIQGDEPMVRPEMLETLIEALFSAPEVEIATLCTPVSAEEAQQPSAVKVVTDAAGRSLYFSRAPIPFPREGVAAFRKHLGYYAYSRTALDRFHTWPVSHLEQIERLEQLRFLENGMTLQVAETPYDTIGIDTAEDLARAEAWFAAHK